MEEKLFDPAAEKGVISALFRYGKNGLSEVDDIINKDSFSDPFYKISYMALEDLISQFPDVVPDITVFVQKLQEKRLVTQVTPEESKLIRAISVMPIELSNVRKMAAVVKKLSIAREMRNNLLRAIEEIELVDGGESLGKIMGIAESAIFDHNYELNDDSSMEKMSLIGEGLSSYVDILLANPVQQVGFPIGLPEYEKAIGGGPRPGSVHMIGARPKTGKTFLVDHICYSASSKGIPVLNLDTEMQKSDHWNRLLAKISGVDIDSIETGNADPAKMRAAVKKLESLPYTYKNIGGMDAEEMFSLIRRWLIKDVGLGADGKASQPCIVIYDYVKLMDDSSITKNIAEHQAIGFLMTGLHNFMRKYGVACVAFVQLNRDGVTKEDSTAASQSDRIIWLCSSFSIFKWKERDDLIDEMRRPEEARFTHKLFNTDCRHGKGTAPGDFIHIKTNYATGKLEEGPLDSMMTINRQSETPKQEIEEEDVKF